MTETTEVNRRSFLRQTGSAALGTTAAFNPSFSATTRLFSHVRPNVVLIVTDDQGYGDIGDHGNPHIHTPHLDRFARQSVEMTKFFVSPVCAPTRASLMTGRYNYRTGVVDTYIGRALMDSNEMTLAEMLSRSGYKTGIFGKWHLGDNHPMRPIDKGFQEALVHNGGGIGQPSDPPGNTYHNPILRHNGEAKPYKGYCTDIFTDAAIRFIEENAEYPFFTYLATNAPHTPLQIDEELVKPYLEKGLDETTAKVYAMVENIDSNIGRLLDTLRELDLEDNTIVIFMTDNGPQQERYNANLRGLKGSVYEGGIRVPCYFRWLNHWMAGKKLERIAAHIDIAPTLLDCCNVDKPSWVKLDGKSLKPLLDGESINWPDRTFFFQWHRGDEPEMFRACAVRGQRYKLVNGTELYDVKNDPYETTDIAAANPDLVQEMRRQYEEWFLDVSSSRGYDPPRIHVGTKYENPVTLTRQDWRGPRAGWNDDSLGYWEIDVRRGGTYEITLRIQPLDGDGFASLKIQDQYYCLPVQAGQQNVTFESIRLNRSECRLEAIVTQGIRSRGALYVDIRQ